MPTTIRAELAERRVQGSGHDPRHGRVRREHQASQRDDVSSKASQIGLVRLQGRLGVSAERRAELASDADKVQEGQQWGRKLQQLHVELPQLLPLGSLEHLVLVADRERRSHGCSQPNWRGGVELDEDICQGERTLVALHRRPQRWIREASAAQKGQQRDADHQKGKSQAPAMVDHLRTPSRTESSEPSSPPFPFIVQGFRYLATPEVQQRQNPPAAPASPHDYPEPEGATTGPAAPRGQSRSDESSGDGSENPKRGPGWVSGSLRSSARQVTDCRKRIRNICASDAASCQICAWASASWPAAAGCIGGDMKSWVLLLLAPLAASLRVPAGLRRPSAAPRTARLAPLRAKSVPSVLERLPIKVEVGDETAAAAAAALAALLVFQSPLAAVAVGATVSLAGAGDDVVADTVKVGGAAARTGAGFVGDVAERAARGLLGPTRGIIAPEATKAAKDAVSSYFENWNKRNMVAAVALFAEDCTYEDTLYPGKFSNREEVKMHLLRVAAAVPEDFQFCVDEISASALEGSDLINVGVQWHVEDGEGNPLPFSRGSSMYQVDRWSGLIKNGFDVVEPAVKSGDFSLSLLSFATGFIKEPLKLVPAAFWGLYCWVLFLSESAPGLPATALDPKTWQMVQSLSFNFWLVLPLGFPGLAAPGRSSCSGQAFVSILESRRLTRCSWGQDTTRFWRGFSTLPSPGQASLLSLPWTADPRASVPQWYGPRNGRSVGGPVLLGMQFLTNAFYLPYLVLRKPETETSLLLSAPKSIAEAPERPEKPVFAKSSVSNLSKLGETKLFPIVLGGVLSVCIYWAIAGRPEYGDLPMRLDSFIELAKSDRLTFAFVVDMVLFGVFQVGQGPHLLSPGCSSQLSIHV
eukprot:scaffold1550_cov245-Pinguiococcus_pyrenoidosus.AAC.4